MAEAANDHLPHAPTHRGMGPITRRLIYALALIPLVPASAITILLLTEDWWPFRWDELRIVQALSSIMAVTAMVLIWRTVVVWTLGRKWLTAIVSLIPFVQVVYAQPLWQAGCLDEVLCVAQYQLTRGFWVWALVWVWWGWEKSRMNRNTTSRPSTGTVMSPVQMRILASFALIPFTFGVFLITVVLLEEAGIDSDHLGIHYAATAVVSLLVWCLIWRGVVAYSHTTFAWIVLLAALLVGMPILLVFLCHPLGYGDYPATLPAWPIIGWSIWMGLNPMLWKLRGDVVGAARDAPRCLNCGYMLVGLTSTRCPECGTEPTIDALFSAMSHQD